jgi:uncharacterized damage-inducible protein DinB
MMTGILIELFQRDIHKLSEEVKLYSAEPALWKIEKNIANSAGNLCLHIVGNLNTYIGATLGNTGYVRHRDLEFSLKNVPRAEMLEKIENTREMVKKILDNLTDAALQEEYPLLVLQEKTSTGFFLTHLLAHLNYHLGQVNYHRRLIDITIN